LPEIDIGHAAIRYLIGGAPDMSPELAATARSAQPVVVLKGNGSYSLPVAGCRRGDRAWTTR